MRITKPGSPTLPHNVYQKPPVVPLGLTTLPISDRLTSFSFTLKMETVLSLETLGHT